VGFFSKQRHILIYGLSMALFLIVLRWLELRYVVIDYAFNVYIGSLALLFTGLGVWLALKLFRPIVVPRMPLQAGPLAMYSAEHATIKTLGITQREWEVLHLMAQGLSNQEIGDRLFVSLNTVKTHSKNLFDKLQADRRTQAVDKARKLGILP